MGTAAHGNIKTLTDVSFLFAFSEIQINQVLENLEYLFNLKDISNLVEIWDSKHSHKILQIINNVFKDVDDISCLEGYDDKLEFDDFFPG